MNLSRESNGQPAFPSSASRVHAPGVEEGRLARLTPGAHSEGGMTLTHPGAVMSRLEELEQALALKQNAYETAATNRAKHVRKWEKRLAACHMQAKGSNADSRKAHALVTAIEMDDLYAEMVEAEGAFEGCRAAIKVLETRAMIGMAILRAQGRS